MIRVHDGVTALKTIFFGGVTCAEKCYFTMKNATLQRKQNLPGEHALPWLHLDPFLMAVPLETGGHPTITRSSTFFAYYE
jgi:hypothetical protein